MAHISCQSCIKHFCKMSFQCWNTLKSTNNMSEFKKQRIQYCGNRQWKRTVPKNEKDWMSITWLMTVTWPIPVTWLISVNWPMSVMRTRNVTWQNHVTWSKQAIWLALTTHQDQFSASDKLSISKRVQMESVYKCFASDSTFSNQTEKLWILLTCSKFTSLIDIDCNIFIMIWKCDLTDCWQ